MRRRQNRETADDETWSKDRRLSRKDQRIVDAVKELYQWRKNARTKMTQGQLAAEIRSVAKTNIGFNQSAASKLLNGQEVPKDIDTVDAIKAWIQREGQKKDIFEKGFPQASRIDSVPPTGDEKQADINVSDQSS